MLKRNLSFEDSDSDTASYYSLKSESSDFSSVSPSSTPAESFWSSNSKEFLNIENLKHRGDNISPKKELKKKKVKEKQVLQPVQSTKTTSSSSPYSRSLSPDIKKKILDAHIMSSNSGTVAKKELKPSTKKDEPEKKKKILKLSFKKKKKSDKLLQEGEDVMSGPDFSGSSSHSSPWSSLDRNVASLFKRDSAESNSQAATQQAGLQIDKEKSSKQASSKEKSDKRLSSFKLLKKDDKKKLKTNALSTSSTVPSSNESLSSAHTDAHESTLAKIESYDNDKAIAAVSSTAKTSDVASNMNRDYFATKLDPPQTSDAESNVSNPVLIEELGVTGSNPKQSYVSTYHISTNGKTTPVADPGIYLNEVQLGKAESKMESSKEPLPPIRSYKSTKLNKSDGKRDNKKTEEKSIAQEIEEIENFFETNESSPTVPTLEESYQPAITEAGSSFDKREHLYKILVIGELGTGKTSIIKRYVHQFFCTHYRATIGVDFALKVLNWDGDTVIRLQLWDIAGQERFGNMTRVYYKQAVGAFIVFDVTNAKTFDAVTKWKTDLDTKVTLPDGSCIPTVLLANKCDQPKEGVVCNPSRMDDFCRERNFVGWFETSAKENINIDEATKFLVSKILNNEKEGLMAQDSSDTDKFSVEGDNGVEEAPSRKCVC